MKGNNTLELCPATVIEALQEYLDARYKNPDGSGVKVVSVEIGKQGIGHTFFVGLQPKAAKE